MSEAEYQRPPGMPTEEESRAMPTLEQVMGTMRKLAESALNRDGTMPKAIFMELTRQDLRNIYAADRYLDELALLREAKRQARARR